jgi:hypothetical protein
MKASLVTLWPPVGVYDADLLVNKIKLYDGEQVYQLITEDAIKSPYPIPCVVTVTAHHLYGRTYEVELKK